MLTNSPSTLLKANVSAPVSEYLRIGASARYESGRRTVYDTNTDPFFVMDLVLSARLNLLTTPFSAPPLLTLRIRNVTNKLYAYPGGYEHIQPAIVQDGRTIAAGLALEF